MQSPVVWKLLEYFDLFRWENPEEEKTKANYHVAVLEAMAFCVCEMLLDGDITPERFEQTHDPEIVELGKRYTRYLIDKEEDGQPELHEKQDIIDKEWPNFLAQAHLIRNGASPEHIPSELDWNATEFLAPNKVKQFSQDVSETIFRLYRVILTHMTYSPDQLPFTLVCAAVDTAYRNDMTEGRSLHEWLPDAIAQMPDRLYREALDSMRP